MTSYTNYCTIQVEVFNYRLKLFLISIFTIGFVSGLVILMHMDRDPYDLTKRDYKYGQTPEIDQAIQKAEQLFTEQRRAGIDFSSGPCLSNDLQPNWVADIVHNPRKSVDNLPANQCPAYLEGRAKHFVELDTNGQLVRVH